MGALDCIIWVLMLLLYVAASGGLMLVALPVMTWLSVRRGLALRSGIPCSVRLLGDVLHVSMRRRRYALDLRIVARARLAENDNWTESRIVENALTLFDARDRCLVKIPHSADGFEDLMRALGARGVHVDHIGVEGPAHLD